MLHAREPISSAVRFSQPRFCHITITIPRSIVNEVYDHTCVVQKKASHTHGFVPGGVPLDYIAHNYRLVVRDHVKEFLYNFFVLSHLFKEIRENKLLIIGEPRLVDVSVERDADAIYVFECTRSMPLEITPWKHFPFRAPQRKKYRDIDRQVDSFIQEETERKKQYQGATKTEIFDFVCFEIWPVDKDNKPLLGDLKEVLWLKIGHEEADITLQALFLDHEPGEVFYSDDRVLHEYFSSRLCDYARFGVKIIDIIPDRYFCFESFKKHFKIKTHKQMRNKLVEVFSFRNDQSQRRLMAEGALHLLLKHHKIDIPSHALLRHQQVILDQVSLNPDYPVYKMELGFNDRISELAKKQLREYIMIDALAHHENLIVEHDDIVRYLNLIKRPRMKEFIYFVPPATKINGQEMPIPEQMIMLCCLREKALNHIIYHLTKE